MTLPTIGRTGKRRRKTLIEIKEFLDIFESPDVHAEAFDHLSRVKGLERSVAFLGETLAGNAKKSFEEIYEIMEKKTGLARRDLMMLLRIAITGRKSGPPLKEVFRLTPEQIILERVSCLQKKFEISASA